MNLQVNCSVRGDMGPACNPAGMIDRTILGIGHLYAKPVYRNLKVTLPPRYHIESQVHMSSFPNATNTVICRNAKYHIHLPGVMLPLNLKVF